MLRVLVLGLAALQTAFAFTTSLNGEEQTPWEYLRDSNDLPSDLSKRQGEAPVTLYAAHTLDVPIDHFHNESKYEPHSNGTFPLRYWFDASCYQPGGPVIILLGGEASAAGKPLSFLKDGILRKLIDATHGIGVVLEHRYYGESVVTEDLSTENLRFLTTQQAMADDAYFAQNIQFPGLEQYGDLTSKTTAYITYGGSYAGALSAFLRVVYPDVFWGAIASSAVTNVVYDFWYYLEPIAEYGPPDCIQAQRVLTNIADNIILGKNDSQLTSLLKQTHGYGNLTYDDDFANHLIGGIPAWQYLGWKPGFSSNEFYNYCANLTSSEVLYPATESLRDNATFLIQAADYDVSTTLVTQMLNFIGYLNLTSIAPCAAQGATQDQCFSNHNTTFYVQDDLSQDWRLWQYQVCTEWGFWRTGTYPVNGLPLVSRAITLEYRTIVCREAFSTTTPPNIEILNQYGGYDISYPRLAFIDGELDPWRPVTPHGFGWGAQPRNSTTSQPFILIDKAGHVGDANGLLPNETTPLLPPPAIAAAQNEEAQFVQEWMQEWQSR